MIEIKIFLKENEFWKMNTSKWEVMKYDVIWIDNLWNQYQIISNQFASWDAWETIAKRINNPQ